MVCLGLEPGAAEWKGQTNPLCYGVTHAMAAPPTRTQEEVFNEYPKSVKIMTNELLIFQKLHLN